MLQINGKTFMNLQEAVQWLLDNNALPFQSSANYVANTEIGMGTIVNPSPAKVRIGSLIFFADSKVSTVIGLTENGFMVSDQYNDLVDDVVYVSNVEINASGHLIVTLSNGDSIDAGLIKQVTSLNINASQHLIANYNDGSTSDLGAIFSGNVNVAGNFTANSIIENMVGYSFETPTMPTNLTADFVYAGVCKNGNKLTFAVAVVLEKVGTVTIAPFTIGRFFIPNTISQKLYAVDFFGPGNYRIANEVVQLFANGYTKIDTFVYTSKGANSDVFIKLDASTLVNMTDNVPYYVRYDVTFLLGDNMAS